MTDNQRKFCDEYLVDRNGTRAYMTAYPHIKNKRSASALASKLLTNINIKQYIDEKLEEISNDRIADVKEIMEYHTSVMRGEMTSEALMTVGTGEGCSDIIRVKKKPEFQDRKNSAVELAKLLGAYTNNLNITMEPITIVEDLEE